MKKSITKIRPKLPKIIPRSVRAPAGDGRGLPQFPPSFPPTGLLAGAAVITEPTVRNIFSNVFSEIIPPEEFLIRTIVADNRYLETSAEFVLDSISTDPIISNSSNYLQEIFDCDDYVQFLKTKMGIYAATNHLPAPLAVGYILTEEHAFSFCIGPGSVVSLINTQSDSHAVTSDKDSFATFLQLHRRNIVQTIYL